MTGWQQHKIHFTILFAVCILQKPRFKPMLMLRISRNTYRMMYSALLLATFFTPAYNNISGFHFIGLAFGTAQSDAEVTFVDLLVVVVPLLFVPLSALLILYRAARRRPFTGLLLALPLFFLLFFFLILSFDVNRQAANSGLFSFLRNMSLGFYMAACAAVLLLLSYSKRESFNLSSEN